MSNAELNQTLYKLSSIAECARGNKTFEFMSLAHLLNVGFLEDCYQNLDRNKAVGIDKVSWQEYGKDLAINLKSLVVRLKNKSFKPMPARSLLRLMVMTIACIALIISIPITPQILSWLTNSST